MKSQDNLQSWEELTFANNFLFCKILESEPELCRQLLELLLHIKIDRLELTQSEKTMQEWIESKSVRFDVYAKDESRIFDIEIQTTLKKDLAKRARYYQSINDMDTLSKGERYDKLKDTYIIFLCLNDPFKDNMPVYFFENTCRQKNDLKLKDGAYKVFFNASCCDKIKDKEEKSFFKFLKGEQADSALTKRIEEKVRRAKANKKWRRIYMTWEQEILDERYWARLEGHEEGLEAGRKEGREKGLEEGREEGRKEGAKQNAIANARNLLNMQLGSPEQIAQAVSLPLEQVLAIKEELAN